MNQSALLPAGPLAAQIAELFWFFVLVLAVVYVAVIAFLLHALLRRRRVDAPHDQRGETAAIRAIGAAVAISAILLVMLALGDFVYGHRLNERPTDAMRVRITGEQWWWEIEYEDADPSRRVRTANELHIPVDRPVELILTSRDVIHSFWVPSLQGKRDLIPGRTTTLTLRAHDPGVYRGQCAEFCGHQHTFMRLLVDAQPAGEFLTWKEQQLAPARAPDTPRRERGRDVFLGSTCPMCHTIQGTEAAASAGPDLTHLGSRRTLASGALSNTPAHLSLWISDPQSVKPGTRMPATALAPADLGALVDYLASLR